MQYNKNTLPYLKNNISSIKYYSKEDMLKDNRLISSLKEFNKENVIYSKDKKLLQKIIMKKYISFIKKQEESFLYNLSNNSEVDELEKIILFVKYNENINVSELIKKIKKLDKLNLYNIIILEQIFIENLTFFRNSNASTITIDTLGKHIEILEIQTSLLLETVKMIKAIKFDYCISSIAYFDEKLKPKKVFTTKKLCTVYDTCFFANNINFTLEDFVTRIDFSNKNKEYYTLNDISNLMDKYIEDLDFNSTNYISDYSKLLLKDKYNLYISNLVDNLNEIMIGYIYTQGFINRKVLLPKNGVLLLVKDEDSFVESILLKEIFEFDINHIVAITKYKDGKEIINTFALKPDGVDIIPCYQYKKEINEINKITEINEINKARINSSSTSIKYIFDFFETGGNNTDNNEYNYEVLSPTYWKYRNRGYKSENDKLNDKGIIIKREFEIEIAPFLRKINGQPSNDAIQLSKKLGLVLEEGYTIVKPHTRTYNSSSNRTKITKDKGCETT